MSSSAAAWVSISSDFRSEWLLFGQAENEVFKQFHFAELMNIFEITCAMFEKGAWRGVTKELVQAYVVDTLVRIKNSPDASERITQMIDNPESLKYVRAFLKRERLERNFVPIRVF